MLHIQYILHCTNSQLYKIEDISILMIGVHHMVSNCIQTKDSVPSICELRKRKRKKEECHSFLL